MSLSVVEGFKSEIYVPITPPAVFTELKKPIKECVVAFLTAGGVHLKTQKPFNLAGDSSYRVIPSSSKAEELMVTHGGYDNSDVNRDINAMFPVDRLRELEAEGFIGKIAPHLIGFMGGGGNIAKFSEETGPEIAKILKEDKVDVALLTAGWGTCHRSAVIVERAIEAAGIPTILIAALPPVAKQQGSPRISAPLVPMGANVGEPHNVEMQTGVLKDTLMAMETIDSFGKVVHLPYEYKAKI